MATNLTKGEINILRAKLRAIIIAGLVACDGGQCSNLDVDKSKTIVDQILKEEGIEK